MLESHVQVVDLNLRLSCKRESTIAQKFGVCDNVTCDEMQEFVKAFEKVFKLCPFMIVLFAFGGSCVFRSSGHPSLACMLRVSIVCKLKRRDYQAVNSVLFFIFQQLYWFVLWD